MPIHWTLGETPCQEVATPQERVVRAFQGMDVGIIPHLPIWHAAAQPPPGIVSREIPVASGIPALRNLTIIVVGVHKWSPVASSARRIVSARAAQIAHDNDHLFCGETPLRNRVTDQITRISASPSTVLTWQQITALPCSTHFNVRYKHMFCQIEWGADFF